MRYLAILALVLLPCCGFAGFGDPAWNAGKELIVVKHSVYTDCNEMAPDLYLWDHPQDMHVLLVPSGPGDCGESWTDRIEAGLRQYRDEGRRVEDMPIRVNQSDLYRYAVEAVERLWAEGQPWRWVEDWS